MRNPLQILSGYWTQLPRCLRRATRNAIIGVTLAGGLLAVTSCAHTQAGLTREDAFFRGATNVLARIQTVAPVLPAPVGSAVELFGGVALAALTAWNTSQHKAIRKLQNGNGNGNGNSNPHPAPTLPITPQPTA
jgi:hypothetical protein